MGFGRRRGISPIIAVLLLILIAIAAGVMVYAFVAGWVGGATSSTTVAQAQLSIDFIDADAGNSNVTVYVRNVGGISAKIASIYVYHSNGTLVGFNTTINTSLPSGSVKSFSINATMVPGEIYVVKVVANDGSTTMASVKAHS